MGFMSEDDDHFVAMPKQVAAANERIARRETEETDSDTGLPKSEAAVVKTAELDKREKELHLRMQTQFLGHCIETVLDVEGRHHRNQGPVPN